MYISAKTLDDLLRKVIDRLLKNKSRINPSRGPATELAGVLLQITNPRARLSRTEKKGVPFGCLGELLWYLAGSKDLRFISYYLPRYKNDSDDGRTIYGGYGPRLSNMRGNINQIKNVLDLLRDRPDSRRAVIQLFDAKDIAKKHKEVPCTCTLQFMVRHRRLHMLAHMRSNDAFRGLPHDVFAFTMIQELFARTLGIDVGTYKHAVGSLHLYDADRIDAQLFLNEGFQETVPMPLMPLGDPWSSITKVLKAERAIRRSGRTNIRKLLLASYWEDLVRLLQIYWYYAQDRQNLGFSLTKENQNAIALIKRRMVSPVYDAYIEKKRRAAEQKATQSKPVQASLL